MISPEDALKAAAHMATAVPHAAALGFELVSIGDNRGAIRTPWREELVGDPATGVIASGVVTALLDHCCGLAITAGKREAFSTATLDLRIDYMRPAAPRMGIIAEAHCYKLTRSIAFVRAQAWDEDPTDPIATAQAAFILNGPAPLPGAPT
ncbi:PaaI family thioesterase [Phenylobacterium aquaticum]|uniref:PaaI family thioesterase n=1 Tax=Phenylobacterium aquaticum TaxID=1763816 RepID=UPI001F5DBFEF|nr:PaaI family thioesterase [Phenylobacterium aquaticum]MCI3134757.1 PaaI family thioesterase [Phenylobacterium aquaticum]